MAVAFALRHYGGLDEYLRIFRDGDHCPRKRRVCRHGIAGSGVQGFGGATATIHLILRDGTAGVSFGAAFRKGDKPYYSASHLVFPSGIVEAWTEPETFLPVSVERDASGLERLLLPDLLTATPELFPDSEQLWGETGEASYIYYETLTMGGIAVPVPIEYHRHVVLTRQQP